MAVDQFVLSSLVTNSFDGLLHFTDDTNLAGLPIKFAPTPYQVSSFPPVLIFSNNVERAKRGVYRTGDTIAGQNNGGSIGARNWTVIDGPVTLVQNPDSADLGTNCVALGLGAIQCALPTVSGHRYELRYAVHGPAAVGWWNGDINPLDRRALDLIGGNDGAYLYGASTQAGGYVQPPLPSLPATALYFDGITIQSTNGEPDMASKIELGDPENLRLTNSFTIEGWIKPVRQPDSFFSPERVEQLFFRGDSRDCLDPYYLALEQTGPSSFDILVHVESGPNGHCGVILESGDQPVHADQWQHVAAVFETDVPWAHDAPWPTNQLRLYVNGQRLTNTFLEDFRFLDTSYTGQSPFRNLDAGYSPGVAIGNRSRADASEPYRGYIDELAVYGRALTDAEIAAIYTADRAGKGDLSAPPDLSLAKVEALIDGVVSEFGYGANSRWSTNLLTFTATRGDAALELRSRLPGIWWERFPSPKSPHSSATSPNNRLTRSTARMRSASGVWRCGIPAPGQSLIARCSRTGNWISSSCPATRRLLSHSPTASLTPIRCRLTAFKT